jgi:MFS family permease
MHAPLAIKQPARWRVIVAGICALILTVGLARFAYTPMLPIMREQAGLTHWAAGWLATVNYAGYMAGTLLAASINDLGRKYLIYRCGLVIAMVSTAAMGWTDSVPVWSVLRFVAGFSSTAGLLLASGLVLNWLIRQGHRPQLGLHFVGLGLGIAVSGVAVAALVQGLPWDRQWLGLGLLGIAFFGPAWLWMPPPVAVQPAAAGTLLVQGFAHRLEQMGFATAGLAPQVGGHRRAGVLAAALTGPQAQVLQGGFIGARIEA